MARVQKTRDILVSRAFGHMTNDDSEGSGIENERLFLRGKKMTAKNRGEMWSNEARFKSSLGKVASTTSNHEKNSDTSVSPSSVEGLDSSKCLNAGKNGAMDDLVLSLICNRHFRFIAFCTRESVFFFLNSRQSAPEYMSRCHISPGTHKIKSAVLIFRGAI